MDNCSFSPNSKNYSAFASNLKLLPVITPNADSSSKELGKVYVFGPRDMVLTGITAEGATFSKKPAAALAFHVDKVKKILFADGIILYPIPYSAAEGISSWKGQSVSTNLSSMKGLQQQLADIKKNLEGLNDYTFTSDSWKGNKVTEAYGPSVKAHYVGIVEEIKGIFK